MKHIFIETKFSVYNTLNELPKQAQQLIQEAIRIREKAYSPYSKFNVGAAILLDNNEIVSGNNQENASYPSGLCAERTAIFYANAQYPEAKIKCIAISATSQHNLTTEPIPPCGSCRQAISEYEIKQKAPIEIYFMGATGQILKSDSLSNLLPLAFNNKVL